MYKIKVLILVFLLNGCVQNNYTQQNSALIVFKTPTLKFADMGFIYQNPTNIKLEIYAIGQALMKLNISNKQICMSRLKCMSPKTFNKEVLNINYPQNILSNIFRGKAIFDKIGLKKKKRGFEQKIFQKGKFDISYKVIGKKIIFRDKLNNILIKIKR